MVNTMPVPTSRYSSRPFHTTLLTLLTQSANTSIVILHTPSLFCGKQKSRTQSASGYGSKETERQQTDGTSCTVRKHLLWFRGTYFYILTSIKTGSSLSFCLRDWHANPFCARCTFGSPLEERSPEPHPFTVLIRKSGRLRVLLLRQVFDFFLQTSFVAYVVYGFSVTP